MTKSELFVILDNEDKKYTLSELQNIIYELETDCMEMGCQTNRKPFKDLKSEYYNKGYYNGEQNAFYLCLRLLKHLKGKEEND